MVCSHQQIEHFRAFGFVVLRGLLRPDEVDLLTDEVRTNIREAYGGIGTDHDPDRTGGIRGDYLPLSIDAAPLSQALMADDPRFFQASAELLGRMIVPTAPIATCFTSNASWHCDDGGDVGGVKFLAHLEPRQADSGALRVLPGSHLSEFADRYRAYWAQDPGVNGFESWPVPGVVLETEPGDVIAFNVFCYHSSVGGELTRSRARRSGPSVRTATRRRPRPITRAGPLSRPFAGMPVANQPPAKPLPATPRQVPCRRRAPQGTARARSRSAAH
jgi:hypothetical protein